MANFLAPSDLQVNTALKLMYIILIYAVVPLRQKRYS